MAWDLKIDKTLHEYMLFYVTGAYMRHEIPLC